MEIGDFLRRLGRRSLLLIIVPLIAAVVAGAWVASQPTTYRATVTLTAPVPSSATPAVVNQFVTDFRESLRSDAALSQMSDKTGISVARLRSGLKVKQLGTSSLVRITFSDEDAALVDTVPGAAATAGLDLATRAGATTANASLAEAQSKVDDARADVAKFRADTGTVLPEDEYRARTSEIVQLQVASAQARAAGDAAQADALDAVVAVRKAQLGDLGDQVVEFEELQASVSDAEQQLETAAVDVARIRALQASAESGDLVGDPKVKKVEPVDEAVKAAGVAGAIVFVLTLLVLVFTSRSGRDTRAKSASSAPALPPPPGQAVSPASS